MQTEISFNQYLVLLEWEIKRQSDQKITATTTVKQAEPEYAYSMGHRVAITIGSISQIYINVFYIKEDLMVYDKVYISEEKCKEMNVSDMAAKILKRFYAKFGEFVE